MQKISTCLWFDGKAEEAMNFYMSVFKNGKVANVMRYGEAGPGPKGSVLAVTFELEGQEFIGLNGGPDFQFTPAISMFVKCQTQAEVDDYWEKLLAGGGKPQHCGWLTDNTGCPGRSCRPSWATCCATRTPRNRSAPCRRCCRW